MTPRSMVRPRAPFRFGVPPREGFLPVGPGHPRHPLCQRRIHDPVDVLLPFAARHVPVLRGERDDVVVVEELQGDPRRGQRRLAVLPADGHADRAVRVPAVLMLEGDVGGVLLPVKQPEPERLSDHSEVLAPGLAIRPSSSPSRWDHAAAPG